MKIFTFSPYRYFGFVLGGLMVDMDLPQLIYGGDFNFIGDDSVGIQFYFYWRTPPCVS